MTEPDIWTAKHPRGRVWPFVLLGAGFAAMLGLGLWVTFVDP